MTQKKWTWLIGVDNESVEKTADLLALLYVELVFVGQLRTEDVVKVTGSDVRVT